MKLDKRWIAVAVVVLGLAGAGASYNFTEDRTLFRTMLAHAQKGDVTKTVQMMDEHRFLTNPPLNIYYQRKRRQFRSRFVHRDEVLEPISSDPQVNRAVALFRQYWADKLLDREGGDNDDFLRRMAGLLDGREMAEQALASDPDADMILGGLLDSIDATGLYAASFYLNGTYGLKVWAKQTVETHHIELPDDSVDVEVVLIEDYLLHGRSHYATLGFYDDGGWVATDNRVYCNAGEYDFDSEKFRVSFLKHEGMHFADIQNYPNLGGPDLEYRAKLIEIMSLSEARVYDTLSGFVVDASGDDRAFSHAYANHHLVRNLSRLLFDSDHVQDADRWRSIPHEGLQAAATTLYEQSNAQLAKDPLVSEVLD